MGPQALWGSVSDFTNSFIKHPKNEIQMTARKAEAHHRGLMYVIPRVLMNPYGLFAIMLFVVFGLPVIKDVAETRREKAKADKEFAKGVAPSSAASPA